VRDQKRGEASTLGRPNIPRRKAVNDVREGMGKGTGRPGQGREVSPRPTATGRKGEESLRGAVKRSGGNSMDQ